MSTFMQEFKERVKLTKMLERLHHWEDDMRKLNEIVETETDEKKRNDAWQALKALDNKCALYASKHFLTYDRPKEICW